MSELTPRHGKQMSRSQRVDRGASLVIATGISSAVFVVSTILAIIGILGATLPILSLLAILGFGFGAYRTINR